MHLKQKVFYLCIIVIQSKIILNFCYGFQTSAGKYESFGNRISNESDNKKTIFQFLNRNRPPAHDTPASACDCSKIFF
jgi:hypothetical protein